MYTRYGMPHARLLRGHHATNGTHWRGSSGGLALVGYTALVPGQLSPQLFLQDTESKQGRTIWHWSSVAQPREINNKIYFYSRRAIYRFLLWLTNCFLKMLLTLKTIRETVASGLLTSEISSSGWINLLVALEVVRVAGLLVTVEGGLETVLLPALGLPTAMVVWV